MFNEDINVRKSTAAMVLQRLSGLPYSASVCPMRDAMPVRPVDEGESCDKIIYLVWICKPDLGSRDA